MDDNVIRKAPTGAPSAALPEGTVIAGRFTIESQAGRGGMGAVYRARDVSSGRTIALKLLHATEPEASRRFLREATLLSTLRHPAIVGYVDHGATESGVPFLAMDWLEGEDLARRLARQPLRPEEALGLLRHATEALSAAHHRGVIHRDLKPSNLFLRHGATDDVVLLDFGLARNLVASTVMTASQVVLGTPGYMAPEQVSGQTQLTPAADIFSLGCVLYECLTGQPPFAAPHFVAALAKILFTEPTPLRALRPELPEALQALLDRMLAKAPGHRLPDASALLGALDEARDRLGTDVAAAPPPGVPPTLAGAEQQLVSVVLASPRGQAAATPGDRISLRDALRTLMGPLGAQAELLADGGLVVTLEATQGSATDPATLAARCALSVLERWPDANVVLTTGRGRLDASLPVGEAMDRAGHLLRQTEQLPAELGAAVLMDEVTAGLLGAGFQLSRPLPGLFLLHGQQLGSDESRPLLGKPTPCVGREQELALLELTFTTCVEESTAQAVLVVAPAGVGKSRLRHEFLRRLEQAGRPVRVLLGRGDPMSAGSADGLLGQALRRLSGVSGSEPLDVRRARLHEHLGRHLPPAQAREHVEFLGELCGVPFSDEHSPKLRAARGDPMLMSVQVSRAWVAFLEAECAHQPVLLVLEDLHWGDVPTLRLMDDALRALPEHPFMVLALARPDVEQLLAAVPAQRHLQRIPLRGLSRKAGAHLVRKVLGESIPEAVADRLVEQAAGNALFLEELIRGVAEGRGDAAPETVLAMLQARLMRLEPEARQVLLAASVFGRDFWPGGVQALLGQESLTSNVQRSLERLVASEWVEPQPSSRFPAEPEYRFRHALVRDAAYALVPDSHKPVGHRLAGPWLEQAGEGDPRILAEHAALGQQPERAVQFYTQAAERLIERNDLPGTTRVVDAALAVGVEGAARVRLDALRISADFWMGNFAPIFERGPAVLAALEPGSLLWSWVIGGLLSGLAITGQQEQTGPLREQLVRAQPEARARAVFAEALVAGNATASWCGVSQQAAALVARIVQLVGDEEGGEVSLERTFRDCARATYSLFFEARPWRTLRCAEQSYRGFAAVGSERSQALTAVLWAQTLEAAGDRAGAEAQLRENHAMAQRIGNQLAATHNGLHLALLLASGAEPARRQEAWSLLSELEPLAVLHVGLVQVVKARAAMGDGQRVEAEAWARTACQSLGSFRGYQRLAHAALSQALLAQGRAAEARREAELGLREVESCGGEGLMAVALRLALAEACLAEGDVSAGESALQRAAQSIRAGAADIPDAGARERFLRQVPENARVQELLGPRFSEGG